MERGFPERFVKRKELNFLLGEVALWRDSGIIDPAQASAIEGLYACLLYTSDAADEL